MVCGAGLVRPIAHRNHTAVAAAHSASHRSFDRDLRWAPELRGDVRDSLEHRFRSAGVNHDWRPGFGTRRSGFELTQVPFKWDGHPSAITRQSIVGREDESDAARLEPIQIEQLRA